MLEALRFPLWSLTTGFTLKIFVHLVATLIDALYTDESAGCGEAIRSFTAIEGHPFGERCARRVLPSRFGGGRLCEDGGDS